MKSHGLVGLLAGVLAVSAQPAAKADDEPKATASNSPAELASWVDASFTKLWRDSGAAPAPVTDDATFLRRAYLDLVGTIPSVAQTRDFLADPGPHKRRKLVETLVSDPRNSRHLARVWRRIMVPRSSPNADMGMQLEPWLQEQFAKNVPYDEFARKVITASGDFRNGSPVVFYMAVGNKPESLADSVSRIFMGVRIGCAQCHNHPFASWKKDDFWGMAAFFAGTSGTEGPFGKVLDGKLAAIKPNEDSKEYRARFLGGTTPDIPKNSTPREVLAQWMTSTENTSFAATAVNRVWQYLFGRGLVDPVDDFDLLPPGKRPAVLDELAARFVSAGFDMRWLISGLCQSQLYQRSSELAGEEGDPELVTRMALKTLGPEQVFDALEQALALPISRSSNGPRYDGQREMLVARLNESFADSPQEYRAGIPQTLLMMNGQLTGAGTGLEESRTLRGVVDAPFLKPSAKIETLYLATLTRLPRQQELATFLEFIDKQSDDYGRQHAYADIFWALINSPEFVLNR